MAPVFTLTDREYQKLRDIGIAIIRGVGVDTGGCNIQFAVNPDTGRIIVIEMNPRVSRSSALASKATGFPIAKIATKLALGYTLDEIQNDITQSTPASFEPTIDYVVTKVPRFAFEKFPGADPTLTTSMKSVGEAMALGGQLPGVAWQGHALHRQASHGLQLGWRQAVRGRGRPSCSTPSRCRPSTVICRFSVPCGEAPPNEQIFDGHQDRPVVHPPVRAHQRDCAGSARTRRSSPGKLLKKAKLAGLSDLQIAHLRRLGDEGENTIRELRWIVRPPPGVQDRRHLRRRIRRGNPVLLLLLRG